MKKPQTANPAIVAVTLPEPIPKFPFLVLPLRRFDLYCRAVNNCY